MSNDLDLILDRTGRRLGVDRGVLAREVGLLCREHSRVSGVLRSIAWRSEWSEMQRLYAAFQLGVSMGRTADEDLEGYY